MCVLSTHQMFRSLASCLVALTACASLLPAPPSPTQILHYPLLEPRTFGTSSRLQQLFVGEVQGQTVRLRIYIEISPAQLVVVGFTPWETQAFTMTYDGRNLDFKNSSGWTPPFPPAAIVADIQQVLWPSLPEQGKWHCVDGPDKRQRNVFFGDRLICRRLAYYRSWNHCDRL